MPMTPQSNAAQEFIYENCVAFHAVSMDGGVTWTMSASVNDPNGAYIVGGEGNDYNQLLVDLQTEIQNH